MSQATFTFRVDENLKEAFSAIAQAQDRSSAQLLRDFMRAYVQDNADKISYDQWFKAKVESGRLSALKGELYDLDTVEAETRALQKSLQSKKK